MVSYLGNRQPKMHIYIAYKYHSKYLPTTCANLPIGGSATHGVVTRRKEQRQKQRRQCARTMWSYCAESSAHLGNVGRFGDVYNPAMGAVVKQVPLASSDEVA